MYEHLVQKIIIERRKSEDKLIFGEITEIAKENGIEKHITLNENVIADALKKQIPKKLKVEVDNRHGVRNLYYFCPSCNSFRTKSRKYCSNCGQALDWKETFRELGLKKAEENLVNLMVDKQ